MHQLPANYPVAVVAAPAPTRPATHQPQAGATASAAKDRTAGALQGAQEAGAAAVEGGRQAAEGAVEAAAQAAPDLGEWGLCQLAAATEEICSAAEPGINCQCVPTLPPAGGAYERGKREGAAATERGLESIGAATGAGAKGGCRHRLAACIC